MSFLLFLFWFFYFALFFNQTDYVKNCGQEETKPFLIPFLFWILIQLPHNARLEKPWCTLSVAACSPSLFFPMLLQSSDTSESLSGLRGNAGQCHRPKLLIYPYWVIFYKQSTLELLRYSGLGCLGFCNPGGRTLDEIFSVTALWFILAGQENNSVCFL